MDIRDEARWRAQGKAISMSLEERADFIACASFCLPGSVKWQRIRERALQQLREAAADSWRQGYEAGRKVDEAEPQPRPVFLGLGVEHR